MSDETLTLSAEGSAPTAYISAVLAGLKVDTVNVARIETTVEFGDGGSVTLVESGENAVSNTQSTYKTLGLGERNIDAATVSVEFADEPGLGKRFQAGVGGATSYKSNLQTEVDNDDDDTPPDQSISTIPPDTPGRVKENTASHAALYLLHHYLMENDEDAASTKDLAQFSAFDLPDDDRRSFFEGGLSRLYRRKGLVDREKRSVDWSRKRVYHYYIPEVGYDELDRLDEPDLDSIVQNARVRRGYNPQSGESTE